MLELSCASVVTGRGVTNRAGARARATLYRGFQPETSFVPRLHCLSAMSGRSDNGITCTSACARLGRATRSAKMSAVDQSHHSTDIDLLSCTPLATLEQAASGYHPCASWLHRLRFVRPPQLYWADNGTSFLIFRSIDIKMTSGQGHIQALVCALFCYWVNVELY